MKKLLTFLLITLFAVSLTACTNDEPKPIPDEYVFELLGEETLYVLTGQTYVEKGYLARYDYSDISESVTISGSVDVNVPGEYEITYTLEHNGNTYTLIRTVIVSDEEALNSNIFCSDVLDTSGGDSGYDKCSVTYSDYLYTIVSISIYVPDEQYQDLNEITEHIENILATYTMISDKYTEYDYLVNVWTINENPTTTHTISESLFNLIEYTLENQAAVVDYYNAAMHPVLELWHDAREKCSSNGICSVPTIENLQAANQYTDPSLIVLDRENLTITMGENMGLDLGGVSKGYVSQLIVEYLETQNIYGYLLNNGQSNISVGGSNPRTVDGSFTIAVTDPTDPYDLSGNHGYAWVYLFDGDQLVTSGDYQKYYVVDGDIYHHIIDPTTLMPLAHSRSVSIITDNAALADLYSTAIFNMTIEEGKAFVNSIEGLDAIWYVDENTIEFSTNFEEDHLNQLR